MYSEIINNKNDIERKEKFLNFILKNNNNVNIEMIAKAYDFCLKYHEGQFRKSGESYFIHPLSVTLEVSKMHFDDTTIIVSLLHDTIEDTALTKDDIEREFSKEIAEIVDGVTKLERIKLQSINHMQIENLKKLFLAMSRDIRVLIVKLYDRLHNMRTIDYQSVEKKIKIATETMEIFAPLAEKIGIQELKKELQDISFKILYPEEQEKITNNIFLFKEKFNSVNAINGIILELKELLNNVKADITGREKTPYAIWLKMKSKKLDFAQLSDIFGFRIITDSIENCYKILGIIHSTYHAMPGRFLDYISTPKVNNYQSIHTSIIGKNGYIIEIQIRTKKMDIEAETGLASHWQYKQTVYKDRDFLRLKSGWINRVIKILEKKADPNDIMKDTKIEMTTESICVFNSDGKMYHVPFGSYILDFVCDNFKEEEIIRFHSAKVNSETVDIRYSLQNGDYIIIIFDDKKTINPNWLSCVITQKAPGAIPDITGIKTSNTNKAAIAKVLRGTSFPSLSFFFSSCFFFNSAISFSRVSHSARNASMPV